MPKALPIGFRMTTGNTWLLRQALRLFRNAMRYWKNDVEDDDFFALFRDPVLTSVREAKTMLRRHFTLDELAVCRDVEVVRAKGKGGDRITDVTISGTVSKVIRELWNRGKKERSRCLRMLEEWCDAIARNKFRPRKHKDPMETRMDEICHLFQFDETARGIFLFAVLRDQSLFYHPHCYSRNRRQCQMTIAMAIDRPFRAVERALTGDSPLLRYDAVDGDGDLSSRVYRDYLFGGTRKMLEDKFYGQVPTADALPPSYYGKLEEDHGSLLRDMISASSSGGRGVNILFHGAPGSGKTSYAKTLARELGLSLYEIRQNDAGRGDCDSPQSRMAGLRLCNERLPRAESLVLVDEADQLLRTGRTFFFPGFGAPASSGSEKGVINSILDDTVVPTIWISNAPASEMDESVRRRFDYSVRFGPPGARQRRAIWRNCIEKLRMGRLVPPDMADRLAARYRTSAGGISMVLANAKRLRPRPGEVEDLVARLMAPHCSLMGGGAAEGRFAPTRDYTLDGLNIRGTVPPASILEALRRHRDDPPPSTEPDPFHATLLLWGPPGTGKTEYVKHLGRALGCPVNVRMGGDLLSMWVGGTEHNIKAAFEEAEADGAILFLDEIDGLVQDRAGAARSWEVTQVNELLHRMEDYRGILVGATNTLDRLDPAILRRFTYKLGFDHLDTRGKRLFFERIFRSPLTPDEAARLDAIPALAPGDYRTVRQSLAPLGPDVTNAMRLDALARESSLKKGLSRPIGF